ncbi:MAG: 1-(5-phosphoribosyl)-5-[(5-phosphoribosylamino)methylideneamino]imidazole-4-carboxamide isomerase [Hydrogenothermaceae bacterium]|nr:1-(5-phosphoribosyl)-5-[(5-phosphoribosylamino)methylideneamino]imidazole-4-carboxamide isomerase [Hydrogenothermaceae bacterium]
MSLKEFIIPAIDIKEGKAVRLYKGEFSSAKVYSENPVDIAKSFEDRGFKYIHIVDLDGAYQGVPKNIRTVEDIVRSVGIKTEFGGGLRNFNAVRSMLDIGIERVIIGSLAYENREEFLRIVESFPRKVVLGVDAKDGKLAIRGWVEKADITPLEFAKGFDSLDIWGYLYTDVNRDGTLEGPNVKGTRYLAENLSKPVIASGGVGSIEDVKRLFSIRDSGVAGVIVGKAIYEGKIDIN